MTPAKRKGVIQMMRRTRLGSWLATLGCVSGFCLPITAHADFTLYTDAADFLTAAPGLTLVDFNAMPLPPAGILIEPSISESGATFIGDGATALLSPTYAGTIGSGSATGPYANMGSNFITTEAVYGTHEVQFDSMMTAIGFDIGTLLPGTSALEVTMELGPDHQFVFNPNTTFDFVGFVFDSPAEVDNLQIYFSSFGTIEGDNFIGLDNVYFGNAGPIIPAPAAVMIGVLGLAIIARRRTSRQ